MWTFGVKKKLMSFGMYIDTYNINGGRGGYY